MSIIEVNGKSVALDGEGYLVNFSEWEKGVGLLLAAEEKIEMTDDHWAVVALMREYYAEHQAIPTARDLVRLMAEKLGAEKGSTKYLTELFPNEPSMQSGKIAGLPRMPGCT